VQEPIYWSILVEMQCLLFYSGICTTLPFLCHPLWVRRGEEAVKARRVGEGNGEGNVGNSMVHAKLNLLTSAAQRTVAGRATRNRQKRHRFI
jgi:hypothetical protein